MGLTRADLEGEMTDEERQSRKLWIDRTQANDKWAKKALKPIGVLLTSHQANRPFLKASVESFSKLGYWITLAYDSYVDPEWEEIDHNRFMPPKDVLDKVDLFLMPHYQTWGGPLYPYFWLLKWGAQAMDHFDYILCANGDFVIEKPEGFKKLFEMLDVYDIMTSGPDRDDPPSANTAGFIVKTEALIEIVDHLEHHLIPWDNYEKHTQRVGNMEGRFGWAIKELGLRQKKVDPPLEDMFRTPGHGAWFEHIGFRHIHAELNYAYRNRKTPPPLAYLDERYVGDHDLKHLKKWEETHDPKVLESWWEKP
jgi:hypothetical protein